MRYEQKLKYLILLSVLMIYLLPTHAQQLVGKTNLLGWSTLSPNLGAEIKLANRSTIELDGMMNLFKFNGNRKYNFLAVRPEYRYWLCQAFSEHFLGAHFLYANYNGGLKAHRYNGNLYGGGISYGYQWYLSPRWNLEATAGIGYVYMDHDVYNRARCGKYLGHENRHYFGITRLAVSLIYIIK